MLTATLPNSVRITEIAPPGSQEYTLLSLADVNHDKDTSRPELEDYLAKNPQVASLCPTAKALLEKIDARMSSVADADKYVADHLISAEQAANLIKSGDTVLVPVGHMYPAAVMKALLERAKQPDQLNGPPVKIFGAAQFTDPALYDTGKFKPKSIYLDAASRHAKEKEFIPVFLHQVPGLIRNGVFPLNAAIVCVSPPDEQGMVSLGTSGVFTDAGVEKADVVIAVVNENVPFTHGVTRIPVDKIDYFVRSNEPLRALPAPQPTEVDSRIAENIVHLLPKNATMQFGIGGVPDAVAQKIAEMGVTGLKIRSEMISDGVERLEEAGALDKDQPIYFAFMMGSEKCLKWLHNNPRVVSLPVEECNDPDAIKKIDNFVAINTGLRLDLRGQINAEMVKGDIYSGVGGQVDFMRGAMDSNGGLAIMALSATRTITEKDGTKKIVSNIIPQLTVDDLVTTSAHDVTCVVTEHGVAWMYGKSLVERAEALAKIAAPEFRSELLAEVAKMKGQQDKGRATRPVSVIACRAFAKAM